MKKSLFVFYAATTLVALLSSSMLRAQNTAPYWSLAGNNNASPASKLGTTNNISLRFYTNNIQRMIINSTPAQGFVGIGTPTPTERLHVNSAAGANALRVQVNASTKLLVNSNGGVSIGAGTTTPANGLYVNGNTGLGTTAPSRKLHVAGTSLFTANLNVSEGGLSATNNSGDGISGIGSVRGVYGFGTSYGVHGVGSGSTAYGLYGDGFVGVYATSNLASGDGVRTFAYASSSYGVNAYSALSYGVYGATATSSSYAGYFAGNVYSTGAYQGSDRILKKDITDVTSAMDLIKKLQPKSYTFRQDGNFKLMNLPGGKHYGLIAQDVEQVLPGLVKATTFETGKSSKPSAPSPSETIAFKALNYTELIPIVVKGMQELDADNKEKDKRITNLEAELADLRKIVMDLKNSGAGNNMVAPAFLEQNIPNPAAGNTMIRYQVPLSASSAKVAITDAKGRQIKTFMLSKMGAGQLSFNTATLAAGTYNYSLWVAGKQVDTKRLMIAR